MEQKRIYKARQDFYYKLLVIYFMFLIVYALMRGNFGREEFTIVFHDPIIYITALFVLYSLLALLISAVKGKEIEFLDDRFVIKNRFGQREILYSDIITIKFSRERKRDNIGRSSIRRARIKLKDRKTLLRIRIGEFYDEKKLINEFKNINKSLHI
ncbi:MAG: hypothetical protein PHN88_13725 [Ignavibacteria bacterium]|nr:hypothetical protein [Ignavibacteria bacterium]